MFSDFESDFESNLILNLILHSDSETDLNPILSQLQICWTAHSGMSAPQLSDGQLYRGSLGCRELLILNPILTKTIGFDDEPV